EEMAMQGIAPETIKYVLEVDLKYGHQISEMTLPFCPTDSDSDLRAQLTRAFNDAHQRSFGYHIADEPVELMSLRLRALASAGTVKFSSLVRHAAQGAAGVITSRQAYFGPQHGTLEAQVRSRSTLLGAEQGPMIIEEPDTTIVVPPDWAAHCDE